MMAKQNRRDFLKTTAATATGTLALGTFPFAATSASAETDAPVDMCITKWDGDADAPDSMLAERLTRNAIEQLGGMNRFVSRGDIVWIKPNIAWMRSPEQAANTNPVVVATLIKMCLDAGARTVKVGDRPCQDPRRCYQMSGIEQATRDAGGQVVFVDDNRFRDMEINGEILSSWPVYPEMVECDLMINVPIVKHHSLSEGTMCMKNYMGVVGGNRGQWHQNLSQCLTDITAFMKPRISVLDAVRILLRNGPTGGNLADVAKPNLVAAGIDAVALDAWGAEVLGKDAASISSIGAGKERGLGTTDYRSMKLKEMKVS